MLVKCREINPGEYSEWDKFVKSVPEGTIYQTTYWVEYIKKKEGTKPILVVAEDEKGSLLGSLLAHEDKCFRKFLRYGLFGRFLFHLVNRKRIIITWRYGPIIYDKSNFETVFDLLLKKIEEIARKRRVLFIKDATYPIHGDAIYFEKAPGLFLKHGFSQHDRETIFVNLNRDENDIWQDFKNSARKAIRKAQEEGIDIRKIGKESLDTYSILLKESRRRSGVELPPVYPDMEMWNILGGERGILDIFAAYKNNELCGAIGILNFNGIVFEIGPAQSRYAFSSKVYTSDILKWYFIQQAHNSGFRLYDLCGISPNPRNEKERSLNQFKNKWGGSNIKYGAFTKTMLKKVVTDEDRL